MKLYIGHTALCRTPAFSYQDELPYIWGDLKEAIRDSAKEFYDKISESEVGDLSQLDAKSRYTLWKYHNRACFRATPFGRFAAITPVPVRPEKTEGLRFNRAIILHNWPDWMCKNPATPVLGLLHSVKANDSAYRCGEDIRYLSRTDSEFEIAAVPYSPELWKVLQETAGAQTGEQWVKHLQDHMNVSASDAVELLTQLVSLQLLLTDQQPNLTGPEFFQRTGHIAASEETQYTIGERALEQGALNSHDLKPLPEFVEFLSRCRAVKQSPDLAAFITAFTKKFEHQEVPLLTALDPELGVGYGLLEQALGTNAHIEALKNSKASKTAEPNIPYTKLHRFILRAILDNIAGAPIQLEQFTPDLPTAKAPFIANSIPMLLRFSDEHIVLDSAGGTTANSLLGRFTLANESVEHFSRALAADEANANPDVIFFDIAYMANKVVDNVSRRRKLYEYELPLLCWSCADQPLALNDIVVYVRSNEIILRSVSLGKRLIPRLASAYNYTLSDLSVFRFLCDLQQQGLQTNFNLQLYQDIPHLPFYPRLQYKQVILSPARWRVPERFTSAKEIDTQRLIPDLMEWLTEQGITFAFKAGSTDQTLCFQPTSPEDLEAFLHYCRRKQGMYVFEALLPATARELDMEGRPYLAEWVIALQHDEQVYKPVKALPKRPTKPDTAQAILPPGGEWLYFQVYCHASRTNELLLGPVQEYLNQHQASIRQWFFIRYADPDHHVRLRIQLHDPANGYVLMRELSAHLHPYLQAFLITDLQVKTYFREMTRYGSTGIEKVEQCFAADSRHILFMLAAGYSDDLLYLEARGWLKHILDKLSFSLEDQLQFVQQFTNYFSLEMDMEDGGTRKLNEGYKSFREQTAGFEWPPHLLQSREVAVDQMVAVFGQTEPDVTQRLLGDLFHMHINRLFTTDQRVHELVAYYYTLRMLQEERGRKQAGNIKDVVSA